MERSEPGWGRASPKIPVTSPPRHTCASLRRATLPLQGRVKESIMLAPNVISAAELFRPRATIDADGTVEGYASLFGELDAARDMVMPGAFAQTLKLRGLRRIPMLFQHDPAEPIGVWLELREDGRGLFARGRLIPEVARGREVLALVRAGAI